MVIARGPPVPARRIRVIPRLSQIVGRKMRSTRPAVVADRHKGSRPASRSSHSMPVRSRWLVRPVEQEDVSDGGRHTGPCGAARLAAGPRRMVFGRTDCPSSKTYPPNSRLGRDGGKFSAHRCCGGRDTYWPKAAHDPGCAKTRAFNLRAESSSQFGQSENQSASDGLSEEANRENGSTLS